jgi:hypothetical protein
MGTNVGKLGIRAGKLSGDGLPFGARRWDLVTYYVSTGSYLSQLIIATSTGSRSRRQKMIVVPLSIVRVHPLTHRMQWVIAKSVGSYVWAMG